MLDIKTATYDELARLVVHGAGTVQEHDGGISLVTFVGPGITLHEELDLEGRSRAAYLSHTAGRCRLLDAGRLDQLVEKRYAEISVCRNCDYPVVGLTVCPNCRAEL